MRLGLFMMPLHPLGRSMQSCLAEDTEKSILIDRLGVDELWVGEHFTAGTEPYPSPMMFMASLLPQTQRLVFGTGVINAPNRNPAVIAAEAAQFDHLSGGRFILGVGTGSLPTDFELFGVNGDAKARGRMLIEHIDIIEKIWSQDPPYDIRGEFWTVSVKDRLFPEVGFGIMPKPLQRPRPPICIPAASPNSMSVLTAARRGWGPISSALISPAGLANHWTLYQEGCLEAGRELDPANWRVVRPVFVAATDEEARARVLSPDSAYRYFFGHMLKVFTRTNYLDAIRPHPDMADADITVDAIIESRLIFGSPQTVLARLIALREQVGPFGNLLVSGMDWSGPNAAWERESLSRIATEVMPAFRRHAAAA